MDGIGSLTPLAALYRELGQLPASSAATYLLGQPATPAPSAQDPTAASDAQMLAALGSGGVPSVSLEQDAVLLGELEQARPAFSALLDKLGQHVDATA
ncbi:MAG TPA: hypothetical protein VFC93_21825 [Chloroflexota bacterium]|nr:hypothetical protein [Chloroflexota bacterium]